MRTGVAGSGPVPRSCLRTIQLSLPTNVIRFFPVQCLTGGQGGSGGGGGGTKLEACKRGDYCICTQGQLKGQFHEINASRKMSKHF
jgi:hypothetical protein